MVVPPAVTIHDGPVYQHISSREKSKHSSSSSEEKIPESLNLAINVYNINKNGDLSLPSAFLNCNDYNKQLAILNDKSFLKKYEVESNEREYKIGFYRLLLELSVSVSTPASMRRCITAFLHRLGRNEIVEEEVLLSILEEGSETTSWKSGLSCLKEWCIDDFPPSLYRNILLFIIQWGKGLLLNSANYVSLDEGKDLALVIKKIMNFLLQRAEDEEDVLIIDRLLLENLYQDILKELLIKTSSGESVNAIGVSMAQITYFYIKTDERAGTSYDWFRTSALNWISNDKQISPFARLAWVKGILVTLADSHYIESDLYVKIETFILNFALYPDPSTQYSALRGVEILLLSYNNNNQTQVCNILEIIFNLWDSPAKNRQIGSIIPKLFNLCINKLPISYIQSFVLERVLAQPSYRKGKYLALEVILKQIGAHSLLETSSSIEPDFLNSLITTIGNKQNLQIASVMAEFWKQLLISHREEEGYVIIPSLQKNKAGSQNLENSSPTLSKNWIAQFVIPPIKETLLSPSERIRNTISSFCLPLLKEIGGNNNADISLIIQLLFEAIVVHDIKTSVVHLPDLQLWTELELIRHAKAMRVHSKELHTCISNYFSMNSFYAALVHHSASIRISSFTVIDYLYSGDLSKQIEIWKYGLPYAFKSGDKSYTSKIVSLLMMLLVNLNTHLDNSENEEQKIIPRDTMLCQFICKFLVPDIILTNACYAGTVYEKELFVVILLKKLLQFFPSSTKKEKKKIKRVPPKITTFRKSCHDYIQETSLRGCTELRDAIFTTLLFSMWDKIRISAYEIALMFDENKTNQYFNSLTPEWKSAICRNIYLCSSPRQRESDTGARLLAIYHKKIFYQSNYHVLENILLSLLKERLTLMEASLGLINEESKQESFHKNAALPLAHGLLQSIELIVEQQQEYQSISSNKLYEEILILSSRAIEISLIVVADVANEISENLEEKDFIEEAPSLNHEPMKLMEKRKNMNDVPLNVNTGAIGANAIFTSLSLDSEQEKLVRAVTQRVVVGSWLLIKQACACLAIVVKNISCAQLSSSIISRSGELLIFTLTALKHQGAAFAAHKALQNLCVCCFQTNKDDVRNLPLQWAKVLLQDVSGHSVTTVKDSTLRRSTGYALGLLAIIRAELSVTSGIRKSIFLTVMASLIRLSLPSEAIFVKRCSSLNIGLENFDTLVYKRFIDDKNHFVSDEEYQWKSRVHALNIIRLGLMDAPLADNICIFAGDMILSSLLGYDDVDSWAVRNSSTMVFSAAMLRVIDPDKNAKVSMKDVNIAGSSAISARELFQNYPFLYTFLISVLNQEDTTTRAEYNSSLKYSILLMISRLQPASFSSVDKGMNELIVPLVKPILSCLGHCYHKVRVIASRALAAICTVEEDTSISSRSELLQYCLYEMMSWSSNETKNSDWNLIHGSLLAIHSLLLSASTQAINLPYPDLFRDLLSCIDFYSSWCNGKLLCPPSCVAAALEIYYDCYEYICKLMQKDHDYDNQILYKIECRALEVISYIELIEAKKIEMIGISFLGAVAGRIAMCCCLSLLFDRFILNLEEEEAQFENLQKLIECNSFDTRFTAIKSLKKYVHLNDFIFIQMDGEDVMERKRVFLEKCCSCVLSAIRLDWNRCDINETILTFHVPTLRRLSRCFLELYYIQENICNVPQYDLNTSQQKSFFNEESLDLIFGLRDIGGIKAEDENALCGNAVELLALFLSDMVNAKISTSNLSQLFSKSEVVMEYVTAIKKLTCPTNEWRIRYSAAVSLNKCSIFTKNITQSIFEIRYELYVELLKLLQDSDEDVRKAAGIALFQITFDEQHSIEKIPGCISVPLLILQKAYEYFCSQNYEDPIHLTNVLSDHLLFSFEKLDTDLKFLLQEFNNSLAALKETNSFSSERLMNLNTDRKVFEDENPNPYEEVLVIMQLTIVSLLRLCCKSNLNAEGAMGAPGKLQELITIGENSLEFLSVHTNDLEGSIDVFHDFTRNNGIFPRIHAAILGSASASLILNVNRESMLSKAELLLSSRNVSNQISKALKTLVNVMDNQDSREKLCDEIIRCCFLLPNASFSE